MRQILGNTQQQVKVPPEGEEGGDGGILKTWQERTQLPLSYPKA